MKSLFSYWNWFESHVYIFCITRVDEYQDFINYVWLVSTAKEYVFYKYMNCGNGFGKDFIFICCVAAVSAAFLVWAVAQAVALIPRLLPPGTVARLACRRYLGSVFGVGVLSTRAVAQAVSQLPPLLPPTLFSAWKIRFKSILFQTKFLSFPLINSYKWCC